MRKIATVVVVLGLMAALAACSPDSKASTSGCTATVPGSASDAVAVSGKYGAKPTVKISSPVAKISKTQRTVVKDGGGDIATKGTIAKVDFTIYNGTTGKELTSTGFKGKTVPFTMDTAKYLPGLVKTIECSAAGSRVVGVIPPADAFQSTGSTDLGVGAKDEIVFVADVVSVSAKPAAALKGASGATVAPKSGLPTVVFTKGVPTITVPNTAQPTTYQEEVLIRGKGAKVEANSNVVVNYQLVLWSTKQVVAGNDTYASGTPANFNTGGVVAGFKKAIEGKTIGSRVLIVVPPADGYGPSGSPQAGISGTDDLVFVIDILGVS